MDATPQWPFSAILPSSWHVVQTTLRWPILRFSRRTQRIAYFRINDLIKDAYDRVIHCPNRQNGRQGDVMRGKRCSDSHEVRRRAIKKRVRGFARIALFCVAITAFKLQSQAVPEAASPEQPLPPLIRSTKGPDLFRAYCASCHGINGKGNGPASVALKAKVPDLTILTKNNRGQFPEDRVRRTITGDDVVAAHGSREMPVWGPISSDRGRHRPGKREAR